MHIVEDIKTDMQTVYGIQKERDEERRWLNIMLNAARLIFTLGF